MKNRYTLIWIISLAVILITVVIMALSRMTGKVLPDTLVRVMGIMDIVAIPVSFGCVIKKNNSK